MTLAIEYHADEPVAMQLIRRLHYSQFRKFSNHEEIPTQWRMENLVDIGRQTTVTVSDAKFDIDIPESVFTKERLEDPSW